MANINSLLKQEIARVARKEIRRESEGIQKAVVAYRHQIAEIKRRIANLERQVKATTKQSRSSTMDEQDDDGGPQRRFRPDGLKKHRERLGLSAQQAGRIMGVSALSVYHWESGKVRPRARQLEAIAALRKMGKREAAAKLAGTRDSPRR
jgi:DNA-binding transcriptional regulator YiaG